MLFTSLKKQKINSSMKNLIFDLIYFLGTASNSTHTGVLQYSVGCNMASHMCSQKNAVNNLPSYHIHLSTIITELLLIVICAVSKYRDIK